MQPFAVGDFSARVPGLPAVVSGALRAATAREPERRPSTRDLLSILDRALPRVDSPFAWAPILEVVEPSATAPDGWWNSAGLVSGVSLDYPCSADSITDAAGERAAVLHLRAGERSRPDEFGSLMQRIPVWHLGGARVRLSAYLRAEAADDASLWVRVDGGGRVLHFDNMAGRALRGTTPWTPCEIQLDIPAGAEWLGYGLLLSGRGAVHATGIHLHVMSPRDVAREIALPIA